jgi:chaperone required for assembly of F1-ATPase
MVPPAGYDFIMSKKIKRFYTNVNVVPHEQGFVVELDKRPVKSPGRQLLVLPHEVFAQSLAMEWQQQEEFIVPATMPIMRFASMVVDSIFVRPDEARAEILKYAHSDLLCYRAEGPDGLVKKQKRLWDPVLERFEREEGICFSTTNGIQYVKQNGEDMKRFAALVAPFDGYELGAVHVATIMTGSAVLAVALYKNYLAPEFVWELCHVDEDFQIEQWGSDSEEERRRQQRYADFCAATLVLSA